ncbi:hypothetical protein D3C76_1408560 [compost metagenome]
MAAKLTRQLIAQPEGEGVGFAVIIALSIIQEREVQVVDFTGRNPFTGIKDTEGETVIG